jgi:hypothetical protein
MYNYTIYAVDEREIMQRLTEKQLNRFGGTFQICRSLSGNRVFRASLIHVDCLGGANFVGFHAILGKLVLF